MIFLYIAIYFIVAALTFVWAVGVIHGVQNEKHSILNDRPEWAMGAVAFLLPPAVWFATLTVYGTGPWVWPVKGVTYE